MPAATAWLAHLLVGRSARARPRDNRWTRWHPSQAVGLALPQPLLTGRFESLERAVVIAQRQMDGGDRRGRHVTPCLLRFQLGGDLTRGLGAAGGRVGVAKIARDQTVAWRTTGPGQRMGDGVIDDPQPGATNPKNKFRARARIKVL